jgi:hypothetical protein
MRNLEDHQAGVLSLLVIVGDAGKWLASGSDHGDSTIISKIFIFFSF